MREIINDFSRVFSYILCIFIIGISFYIIWSNLLHMDYLNDTLNTFSTDQLVDEYNGELEAIKEDLDSFEYEEGKFSTDAARTTLLKAELSSCMSFYNDKYSISKYDNAQLTFNDLFYMNKNFGEFYDDCWVSSLYELKKTSKVDAITKLYDNSNKVNSVLIDNYRFIKKDILSNVNNKYVSDISKKTIKNDLQEDYNMIMNNYITFLKQIRTLSEYLGGDLLDN